MRTVAEVVQNILLSSQTALEAMQEGLLNRTAFAKKIQKEVQEQTFKEVTINTIVVALSRTEKNLNKIPALIPHVVVSDLNIKSPIFEITFEKTTEVMKLLSDIDVGLFTKAGYFTVTEGITEITIICSQDIKDNILFHFKIKPKSQYDNLTAVTIKFPPKHLDTPNIMYAMMNKLAVKRINLTEVVSTYTELTFVFANKYTQEAIQALKPYFV